MTPDERRAMRELLGAALRTAVLPGATPAPPAPFVRPPADTSDMVARFTTELTALGGFVHEAGTTDGDTLAAIVETILGATPHTTPPRALSWADEWLPTSDLPRALAARGFIVDRQEGDAQSPTRRAELAEAQVGLTGAHACLSETGSVVLVSGPGRGRLASLLPPVHIVLATRASIVRSLPDFIAARPDLVSAGSNYVCITGPSRTADIEHTLSRGVHGPREVHVVFCD